MPAPATQRLADLAAAGKLRELSPRELGDLMAAAGMPPIAGGDPALDALTPARRQEHDLEMRTAAALASLEAAVLEGVDTRSARNDFEPPVRTFPVVELRAAPDSDPGTFEAIFAVIGNVDSYGDRIVPGAFTKTFSAPPEGRGMPPVVWSHEWRTPPIGATLEAREITGQEANEIAGRDLGIPGGAYARGQLLVGQGIEVAEHVWAALNAKGGDGRPPLREFSFGFRTVRASFVEEPDEPNAWFGEVRELEELELYEWGPCLLGANPATALLAAKSRIAGHVKTSAAAAAGAASASARTQVTEALFRARHRPPGVSS